MKDSDKAKGETLPVQGGSQERVPRMPHERDESASSQSGEEPSAGSVGQAGHDDVERGVVDTTRGAELDRTYENLRSSAPDPVPEEGVTPWRRFRP
jgi:hypothetical protein